MCNFKLICDGLGCSLSPPSFFLRECVTALGQILCCSVCVNVMLPWFIFCSSCLSVVFLISLSPSVHSVHSPFIQGTFSFLLHANVTLTPLSDLELGVGRGLISHSDPALFRFCQISFAFVFHLRTLGCQQFSEPFPSSFFPICFLISFPLRFSCGPLHATVLCG